MRNHAHHPKRVAFLASLHAVKLASHLTAVTSSSALPQSLRQAKVSDDKSDLSTKFKSTSNLLHPLNDITVPPFSIASSILCRASSSSSTSLTKASCRVENSSPKGASSLYLLANLGRQRTAYAPLNRFLFPKRARLFCDC